MRASRRLLILLGALTLGACSSLNPFSSDDPKLAALKPIADPLKTTEIWHGRVGDAGAFVFQPATSGNAVFAAGKDGTLVRLEGGRQVWKTSVNTPLSGGVGSDGRLVLAASPKGEVIALDAVSGQIRWRTRVNAEVLAAPAVSDAVIVVRSADSRLFGLDPVDGKQRWTYQRATPPLSLRNAAGVVLDAKAIFAGFPGGKLAAINPASGALMWEGTVAVPRGSTELERVADITSLPVVAGRAICAVAYQGRVACFDLASGSTLWTRDLSSSRGLDVDAEHLFVTDEKGAIHSLDLANGASSWKQDQLAGRGVGRPTVIGRHLVVGDREGYVHILRKDDGSLVGRQRTDSSPIVADVQRSSGDIVVQTRDGNVYALGVQ